MQHTKEQILVTALTLFAQEGYEAVSVSDIAGQLGITKGALYRHYQSKRDIFDQIVSRMEALDLQNAQAFSLPEGQPDAMAAAYRASTVESLVAFSLHQFRYWTEEPFPAAFRKMLTLEQYRSAEMMQLYQQYLGTGPLGYVQDLLTAWRVPDAAAAAVEFYAPMFLLYSAYDAAADPAAVTARLAAHLGRFAARWSPASSHQESEEN